MSHPELEPRTHESEGYKYTISHRNTSGIPRHERVVVEVYSKKLGRSLTVVLPVDDAFIVGDLISTVHIERRGHKRMEVFPDELQPYDIIEGMGAIEEIETFEMDQLVLVKVTINEVDASTIFTRHKIGKWNSTLGINRPIKADEDE